MLLEGWSLVYGFEANRFFRFPRVLFLINDKRSRQELDLVAENLEGNRAGQEGQVFKDALSKRHIEGSLPGCSKIERGSLMGAGIPTGRSSAGRGVGSLLKNQGNIRQAQSWLIYDEGGTAGAIRESDFPGSFSVSSVLDPTVGDNVKREGDDKGQKKVSRWIVAAHAKTYQRFSAA
jgi:hypothetical protein